MPAPRLVVSLLERLTPRALFVAFPLHTSVHPRCIGHDLGVAPRDSRPPHRRLAVILWGTTAFGAIHTIAEYVAMIIFSGRDWDTPPGTGYLTLAVTTICAILTVIMTLRAPERDADDDSHAGHKSGSLTSAGATAVLVDRSS
jgi:hypothetical protein